MSKIIQVASENLPLLEMVRREIAYCPETGLFTRIKGNVAKVGAKVSGGYIQIKFRGRRIQAHRLAWALAYDKWPSELIDHKNGIRDDNRLTNLRPASHHQNSVNKKPVSGRSSLKGVSWHKATKKWVASICTPRKRISLGYFDTEQAAFDAYEIAARQYHGEFTRLA